MAVQFAWPVDAPLPLRSEQVAVVVAMLWVLQFRALLPEIQCKVKFDCLAAGYATNGRWQAPDHFGEQAHLLELFLREQPGLSFEMEHVKAHAGDPWNELSDVVAKEAARGKCPLGRPPQDICLEFQALDLKWLVTEAKAATSQALCIRQGRLVWNQFRDDGFRLSNAQLIPIKTAAGLASTDAGVGFQVHFGTLNVQGYGGRGAYIEAQLDAADFNIVAFQETKAAAGITMTKKYLKLGTDSLSRWGTAIWIHRQRGLFECSGRPVHIDEHDIEVLAESPRLLNLKVSVAGTCICIVAAHCPHEAKRSEFGAFLEVVEQQLHNIRNADLVLCGIDLNGRLPGDVEGVTGPVVCGEPDVIGKRFAQMLGRSSMWVPATYRHLHHGEDCTFVHPTGSEHRIDYVVVGGLAACHCAHSQIHLDFDTGAPREDHRLAGLWLSGRMQAQRPRATLKRPKFDREKLLSMNIICGSRRCSNKHLRSTLLWTGRPPVPRIYHKKFGVSVRQNSS